MAQLEYHFDNKSRITKPCHRCGQDVINPAKSKRLVTCPDCISVEKYGLTVKQRAEKKQRERLSAKKPVKIQPFSLKNKPKEEKLKELKKYLKAQNTEGSHIKCDGCEGYFKTVDASHIISKAKRPDLAHEADNLTNLCRECHNKWESFEIHKMLEIKCFTRDMRYVYDNDHTKFQKILLKLFDFLELHPTNQHAHKILEQLEKFEQ